MTIELPQVALRRRRRHAGEPMRAPRGRLDAVRCCVAVVAGAATWMLAHWLTHTLWELLNPARETRAQFGGLVGAIGIALLAVIGGALTAGGRRRGRTAANRASSIALGVLGPATFVAAETIAHAGLHHGVPPVELLLIAASIYGVVCVLPPMAAVRLFDDACDAWATLLSTARPAPVRASRAVCIADRAWAAAVVRSPHGSRAPPFGASAPFLVTVVS